MEVFYSIDDESYNFENLGDLFDALDEDGCLEVGAAYFEANCRRMTAQDVVPVGWLLDAIGERMHDEVGEAAADFPNVSQQAKDELQKLLSDWIEKHDNPGSYWTIVGKARRKVVTEDDLKPNHEVSGGASRRA